MRQADERTGKLARGDARRFVKSIDNLPTLPGVVAKVTRLVEDPKASAADINNAIRQDIALSARILRLVNSSFYGFPRKIGSITHAVVILGFNTVRNVVLSAFVLDTFEAKDLPFGYRDFWIHSLGAAVASEHLARRRGMKDFDDAFMAGLLHDIGKVVLHQYARDDFAEVLDVVKQKDCLIMEAEREVLGMTHAEVGEMLLDEWHLPVKLVKSVARHHDPAGADEARDLASIVHVADIFVRALLVGNGGDARIPRASQEAWGSLGVELSRVEAVARDLAREMRRVDVFMELV